jgi:hypothetical protein
MTKIKEPSVLLVNNGGHRADELRESAVRPGDYFLLISEARDAKGRIGLPWLVASLNCGKAVRVMVTP